MKIVFMGTPDFAVGSLKKLKEAGHDIVGVFTQPDKPQGRKMVLTPPPVKVEAERLGIPVFQPNSVRTDESLELLKKLDPELITVVAYGKILPEQVLSLPKYGCINAHASLLPKYRGASPIQWSIYCGEQETGVTTMQMDIGMDTGDMLLQRKVKIENDDNFETLHDKLAKVGAELLAETVAAVENGTAVPVPQPEEGVSYAPIIKKEMGLIDFNDTAEAVSCKIRAFTPWPSAYFFIGDMRVKAIKAETGDTFDAAPGEVVSVKNGLTVACGGGTSLRFTVLQPDGKGQMSAEALLNGHPVALGTKL